MKLVSFEHQGGRKVGVVDDGDRIRDVSSVIGSGGDMNTLIRDASRILTTIGRNLSRGGLPLVEEFRLLAPIPEPVRNIFCAGKNYYEHAQEFHDSGFDSKSGSAVPDCPIIFTKATTSVIGPEENIPASSDPTGSVDYEGELAVVLREGGRGIPATEALECVFGYVIVNDVTSRELQKRHGQWVLGKGMDGFCPMGPWLVTADEVGPPEALTLITEVNGECRQSARVSNLIFDIPTLIAAISERITLLPGDVIATGTPPGVGIGYTPPRYLQPGDTVTVSIDRLGQLTNTVS